MQAEEWLCLNCQVQRAQAGMKTSESPTVKPQPIPLVKDNQTPSKVDKLSTAPVESIPDEKPAADEKKSAPAQEIKKEISIPCPQQKAGTDTKATDTITPRKVPPKQNDTQPDPAKTQQQPPKDTATPVKSAPPAEVGHPKQESNFFGFGLGGPKAQPSSSKPSESTTGKFFRGFGGLTDTARSRSPSPQSVSAVSGKVLGFGSSIFSSASNLISSTVQDEPSTTPPTSRKGSTISIESGKSTTAPASRKGSVASAKATPPTYRKGSVAIEPNNVLPEKENKPPVEKKPEQLNEAKVSMIHTSKKDKPETAQDTLVKDSKGEHQPATCPLCEVDLNMGSKDPPNYNTCTECKCVVCHLCGFNPMPHLAEVSHRLFCCLKSLFLTVWF